MKKIWKKGLSLLLALVMIAGLIPVTTYAAVDGTGKPTDLKNSLVLSVYIGDGFPGEPAVYGTSNYRNFNSNFKVQSGATFKRSAESELNEDILDHLVQGTPSGNTSVWGAYDAGGMKSFFKTDASIIQPENEAEMIRSVKSELKNASDATVLAQYEIVWYVIKLQHNSGSFWGSGTTEWHIDGVIKEKEKISINYYGNGNTGGAAPKGKTDHIAGEPYTILDENTMVKMSGGVQVGFLGWSAKADGTGAEAGFYQPGEVIRPTESISLYAMWDTTTQYTATVKTYLDDVVTSESEIHGSNEELYLSTDNTHFYSLTESTPGVYTTKITGNGKFHLYKKAADGNYNQVGVYQLTIYNQHGSLDIKHYSVSYDANGGTFENNPGKQVYYVGDEVMAVSDVPVKEGYRFLGWKDEDNNLIQAGEVVTDSITKAVKLTAVWEKLVHITINVTINHISGEGYDQMDTKEDVVLELVSRANDNSAYLETGDRLVLSAEEHFGFDFEQDVYTTKYIAEGPIYTEMPGGAVDYTVVTSKSGYDTSVKASQDAEGNWILDVEMKHNPKNFDLHFSVNVNESVPAEYIPNAAIVKVTFWASDRNQWEIITQQEGGLPGVRVDIDPATRQGSGSYPVWMYESTGSTPYGYRIQITAFVYPDDTIVPAADVVTEDVAWTDQFYTATVKEVSNGQKYGALYGAYFSDDIHSQKGQLEAEITVDLHDVTFDAQGGTVRGEEIHTLYDQYKIPAFNEYVPTRDGGHIFNGWYEDSECTIPAVEGKDLKADTILYAKWMEPLTISGTITIAGTYEQNGEKVPVHDIDRAKEAVLVLQEVKNGIAYDVDSIVVEFEDYEDADSVNFSFSGIPNDGKKYQIQVLLLNYGTTYDNESDADSVYSAIEYTAEFGGDSVADVDAYLEFVPPSYDQVLKVDATQIGESYRPETVLSEVMYRDTGDNHPFQKISQHDVEPYGVIIGLNEGVGTDKQSVWKWHTDGTLYEYQMNVIRVDDTAYNSDTDAFYIVYENAAYWDGTVNAPTNILKATLIPKMYKITFDLNAEDDAISGMDEYLQEDGSYSDVHTWSFDTPIDAVPEREGYIFRGWEPDVTEAYDGSKIGSEIHQEVVLTALWEEKSVGQTYTIIAKATPEKGGTVSGGGTYYEGTEIVLKAEANEGYTFVGWFDENGSMITSEEEFNHVVVSDKVFKARYNMISNYENDYAYIYGYTDTIMGAEGTLHRNEAVVMVHRLVKQNNERGDFVYDSKNPSFADIQGTWYQSAVEYIHYRGGFSTEEGGNINPLEPVTRGEVFKIVALGMNFTDDTTLTYKEYGEILAELGYIVGSGGNGEVDPDSRMTRAQFCTMYNRIIGRTNALLVDADGNEITAETYGFNDLDPDAWYYENMLRATSAYDENGYVDIAKRAERNSLDFE